MMSSIGEYSISLAVLTSVTGVFAALASARFASPGWLAAARWSICVTAAAFTSASVALALSFLRDDFSIAYVASYSERAMDLGYKIAAVWAGQEGSLLLWAWMLAILCTIAVIQCRKLKGTDAATTVGVLAAVCGFFAALLLFAANPFAATVDVIPNDGRGLNPQLQNPGMVLHPPLLFMGYAACAIPFAVLVGALVAARRDNHWLGPIRRWLLVAWLFLTAGILLGAWWAYVELGWGGYWAWDPVENASLLPWLTATALLHSIMVQQHRGMFKRWNACLLAATFILCIFGTYLTRSGVISSVHTFAPSLIGSFFLVFIIILCAGSAGLIGLRFRSLAPERRLEGVVSREGAFLLGNVVLTIIMLVVLIGTTFPILSGVVLAEPVTVKAEFYNRVVGPIAILLVGVMALAPVLFFGKTAASKIGRSLIVPGILAALVTGVCAAFGILSLWALVCIAIASIGTFAVIDNFVRSLWARRKSTGENWITAAMLLIDRNHRRYGGQLAHLGTMMIVVGIVGSSLYNSERIFQLRIGELAQLGDYSLTLQSLDEVNGGNYVAVQATVELREPDGTVSVLTPQKRLYNKWQDEFNTEVALRSTLRDDIYVVLAGWEAGGEVLAIQALVNPLVLWIWLGGFVMVGGCLFSLLPRLWPAGARATQPALPVPVRRQPEVALHPAIPQSAALPEVTT